MSRYTKINNPKTNEDHFGYIPAIPQLSTERAAIFLFEGFHSGPKTGGKGFGVAHMLAAHETDIKKTGVKTVADYVALFLKEGTPVWIEDNPKKSNKNRVVAMRRGGTMVVLEYLEQREENFWSIVTAYKKSQQSPASELCKIEKAIAIKTDEDICKIKENVESENADNKKDR